MRVGPGVSLLFIVCCTVSGPTLAWPGFDLGGRLDLDAAYYSADQTPLESGWKLRRLRLEAGGALSERLSYYVLADFKDGSYRAQASWLRYRQGENNEFYLGRIEIPFSLQRVTSSQYNLFMERALPAALSRHYGSGFVYQHKGETWSFRAGVFGKDRLNFGGSKTFGPVIALRTGRRIRAGESSFWLGASVVVQEALETERVRARPESSVTNKRLVDSGRLSGLNSVTRLGIESLWKKGPWSLQAEWTVYRARQPGSGHVSFNGGYLEFAYMFNGRRRFNFRRGEWMSPQVTRRKSWELAFRTSHIDLQNKLISGGRQTNYSVGLNYYINPINRIQLQWTQVRANPNRRGVDESPAFVQARLQLGF